MSRNPKLLSSLAALALGALLFAGGVVLARAWLPKWHADRLPEQRFFIDRYRELAQRAGVRLTPGDPSVSFQGLDKNGTPEASRLDGLSPDAATALGGGLIVQVKQPASLGGTEAVKQQLIIHFLPSGEPWGLLWGSAGEAIHTSLQRDKPSLPASRRKDLVQLLLRPGERLATETPDEGRTISVPAAGGQASRTMAGTEPILGSRPPQQMFVVAPPGDMLVMMRQLASPQRKADRSDLPVILLEVVPLFAGTLAAVVLFLVLLGKRRIDFVNGAWLAALLLATSAIPVLVADPGLTGALSAIGAFFIAAWALLLWATGESFLRAVHPGTSLDLDTLRAGRLGPRGGRSLVDGVAAGAILAGLQLAAQATAAHLPGAWPADTGPGFPIFGTITPFFGGAVLASGVAIALGLAGRFLPARWAPWAAALGAGLAIPVVSLRPVGWQVAMSVAAAGLLVLLARRDGLAALLAAAVCACLFPAAAFSSFHLSWLPASFLVTAGVPLLLLVAGFAGLRRPEWAGRERLPQPAFVRRLEDERRLRYEMDLLARMQRELLPEVPEVEGWEIAVRSLLATEAGGDLYDFLRDPEGNLWIAAGDVAGHGYSCAIVQAMTAAALTSTITATRTPSEVLREVDRVIRRGGSHRNFTSLALVRLDPRTGRALLGNAGHPFPLLLAHDGEVEEIDLPGLPLGQGPNRRYADLPFEVPPGGALVFCSDGLFEGTDARENQYGYDRPRELLRALGDRSAAEILEALFADWRKHLGTEGPPADDTTVLVVKRKNY